VCQSFSKNFGLYNERAGNVIIVTKNPQILSNCKSQFELLIRQNYSNPPNHGARIVATALNNKSYYQEWLQNLSGMSQILLANRSELYEKLRLLGTPGSWVHLKTQLGFFSYTGLTGKLEKIFFLNLFDRIKHCISRNVF
jgi:aspartate aminotransferase